MWTVKKPGLNMFARQDQSNPTCGCWNEVSSTWQVATFFSLRDANRRNKWTHRHPFLHSLHGSSRLIGHLNFAGENHRLREMWIVQGHSFTQHTLIISTSMLNMDFCSEKPFSLLCKRIHSWIPSCVPCKVSQSAKKQKTNSRRA